MQRSFSRVAGELARRFLKASGEQAHRLHEEGFSDLVHLNAGQSRRNIVGK